jgi:2-oxoglutarate dehydrogenase E1 component
MFTQPQMYSVIKTHKNPMDLYAEKLIGENSISEDEYKNLQNSFSSILDAAYKKSQDYKPKELDWLK